MFSLKNLWIGFSAFSLTLTSSGLISLSQHTVRSLDLQEALFIGAGTFAIYSLPAQLSFRKNKLLFSAFCLTLIIFSGAGFLLIRNLPACLCLGIVSVLSFFYVSSFPVLKIPVRKIPYLKSVIIAICWVSACVVFPQLNAGFPLDYRFSLSHLCFFIALTIPFDIRDYEIDRHELRTLVHKWGIISSKMVALALISCFYLLISLNPDLRYSEPVFDLNLLYLAILILIPPKKIRQVYYDILLDSSIVFLAVSYFLN